MQTAVPVGWGCHHLTWSRRVLHEKLPEIATGPEPCSDGPPLKFISFVQIRFRPVRLPRSRQMVASAPFKYSPEILDLFSFSSVRPSSSHFLR